MKHIASVSFGKDSLAMLLMFMDKSVHLDGVVFYDTGMEFKAVYSIRDRIKPILAAKGIEYEELTPAYEFKYKMFDKPVQERGGGTHNGYSWCGGRCRWGTTDKLQALDRYAKENNALIYVGIAADESERIERERKPFKRLPLVDWGMSENECLNLCYASGFDWKENGIRLYDILDRVSCWCCGNKNLKELRNIYEHLPEYWEQLKGLQARTCRPMKGVGKSVFELEERFKAELRKRDESIQMQLDY